MIFFFFALFSSSAFAGGLDGLWRQDCRAGYQKEERIQGSQVAFTERSFRDHACERPAIEIISRGALIWGALVARPRNASELDFVFSSVSLIPRDRDAAAYYEALKLCGLSGWRVGEEKEITGLVCSFFGEGSQFFIPLKGTRKFGIVKAGAEEIFFGRLSPERDGSSPLKRPLELEERAFRRVTGE